MDGPYLVTYDWLFNSSQVLERRQKHMAPVGSADILDKGAELLAKGDEHLIFVFDALCRWNAVLVVAMRLKVAHHGGGGAGSGLTIEKGNQLHAGALGA